MRRAIGVLSLCAVAFALGIGFIHLREDLGQKRPDGPAVLTQLREVARLETLDVNLYKKIDFAPEPTASDTLWGDLKRWAKSSLSPSRGKAIVFATAHVGLSLEALDPEHVRISGDTVQILLPPLETRIELRPGETEVIDSNLDSAETAQLLQLAKEAFEREVSSDPALKARAMGSARRAITGVLLTLGFRKVEFPQTLPTVRSN